jgi:hypothetical protein
MELTSSVIFVPLDELMMIKELVNSANAVLFLVYKLYWNVEL